MTRSIDVAYIPFDFLGRGRNALGIAVAEVGCDICAFAFGAHTVHEVDLNLLIYSCRSAPLNTDPARIDVSACDRIVRGVENFIRVSQSRGAHLKSTSPRAALIRQVRIAMSSVPGTPSEIEMGRADRIIDWLASPMSSEAEDAIRDLPRFAGASFHDLAASTEQLIEQHASRKLGRPDARTFALILPVIGPADPVDHDPRRR